MIRALIGVVALSLLVATAIVAPSALAQGQSATIQATGTGTASTPASTAHLQFLVGTGAMYGMDSVSMEAAIPDVEAGTPVVAMPAVMPMNSASLSEQQLTPILDALGNAGIGTEAIQVTIPVYGGIYGPGGPETAEIRVTIDQPQRDELVGLIQSISTAAAENGLTVLYAGARYDTADCAALMQQARTAAIADATVRANGLAQGLGVTLGALQQASEMPYFGSAGSDGCAAAGTEVDFGSYGPSSEPAFDPDTTEATVTVQVTLTYAFDGEA